MHKVEKGTASHAFAETVLAVTEKGKLSGACLSSREN